MALRGEVVCVELALRPLCHYDVHSSAIRILLGFAQFAIKLRKLSFKARESTSNLSQMLRMA